jgi:hypothetical protein
MRTGRAIIVSACRAIGLAGPAAAIAAASEAGSRAPAPQVRPAPASPHLLYHG